MALVKVDDYYVTDIRFFLMKKYHKEIGTSEYYIIKNRFTDKTDYMTASAKNLFATSCVRKCLKLYSYGKKNHNEELMRKCAVATFAILDSI